MFETETQTAIADVNALSAAAEAQVASDQQTIASLNQQTATLQAAVSAAQAQDTIDEQKIAALLQQIQVLTAQLGSVQLVKVYERLESNVWSQNSKAQVGGSGLGIAAQKQPGVECAELSIAPQVGQWFDCYFEQTFHADDSKTKFTLEGSWLFPALSDTNASQALEMEARQVISGGQMFVPAIQFEFSGGQVRYWDAAQGHWLPFGLPLTRFTPLKWYAVKLEAHRDAVNVYYDALTINGVSVPMNVVAGAKNLGWTPLLRAALQLDGNSAGAAYRVKIDDVRLTLF